MQVVLKDTLNSAWKNDKSGFGFKMLQKMGWSEDQGLGKNATGITANIKIKRREDGLGLGMEKQTDGAGNKGWSQTSSSFNEVLGLLKESYGKKESKKKSKKVASISVGMKYKKMSMAKDMSTKTEHEKKAILGAAMVSTARNDGDEEEEEGGATERVDADEAEEKREKKKRSKEKKKRKREEE